MKWTCVAATLAFAGLAFGQDDDDLGLPQLDAPLPERQRADGYFMHDGVAYALIGTEAVPLEQEVMIRVTPKVIVGFNGRPIRLPKGIMYTTDARLAPLPIPQEPAEVITPTIAAGSAITPTTVQTTTTQTVVASTPSVSVVVSPGAPGVTGTAPMPATAQGAIPVTTQVATPATVAPQPPFASISRPDRTGPAPDPLRPVDRTRPESVPEARNDATKVGTDDQRPQDRTRQGVDNLRYRDRTMPGTDDLRPRDRTMPGEDDRRVPDPTRRRDR